MKFTGSLKKACIVIGTVIMLLDTLAAGPVQAAVAQGRAGAEVVDPAAVDCSRMLAETAAGAAGVADPTPEVARPVVRLITNEGERWLSIDYN